MKFQLLTTQTVSGLVKESYWLFYGIIIYFYGAIIWFRIIKRDDINFLNNVMVHN